MVHERSGEDRAPRTLEVKFFEDGRISLSSLGGGMPVSIIMSIEEAEDVMNGLRTTLEDHYTEQFANHYYRPFGTDKE